ncbi:MAG: DUF5320 domain-containing protein [Firmicutes bacterium]|nr:DUF5320 domain-containing protein [Bacillota bacterium]
MPGGDGTGPRGFGPRTGRGAGFCSGYAWPGYAAPWPRRRFWGYAYPGPRYFPGGYGDEKEALKQQAEFLKDQIGALEARLKEIEGEEGK